MQKKRKKKKEKKKEKKKRKEKKKKKKKTIAIFFRGPFQTSKNICPPLFNMKIMG